MMQHVTKSILVPEEKYMRLLKGQVDVHQHEEF